MKQSQIADVLARQLLALRTTVTMISEQIDAALLLANGLAEEAHARESAADAVRSTAEERGIVKDDERPAGPLVFGKRHDAEERPATAPPEAPALN